MKSILMSIRPQYVTKILNKEKTIEVRKKFPKDYVGWVYIYCTKGNKHECLEYADNPNPNKEGRWVITSGYPYANGKVVARFWCDKVEEINHWNTFLFTRKSCLTLEKIDKYLGDDNYVIDFSDEDDTIGYAIHITKLEIFDKPKELSEFWNNGKKVKGHNGTYQYSRLTRAPQSFCFIEV